nr:hypothetical protein [Tanacetum cinerariifolium]
MEIDSNKVRSVVNQDRLSALPDELIHQILSCFDTKFAVQTSMLSSRWKLIWKSVPCVINVIAPQVENLTVISCSINNIKAPLRLSYFCYYGYHPKWFKNCFRSLNEVSVSLSIYKKNQPYEETAARETINMLQELRSARCLTLNMDIVECISSFPDLLSHLPSPFSNLISLNIISYMRDDAYKVKLPTEARNFLLEDSPSATFIMDLPEVRSSGWLFLVTKIASLYNFDM